MTVAKEYGLILALFAVSAFSVDAVKWRLAEADRDKPDLLIIGDSLAYGMNPHSRGPLANAMLSEVYDVRYMGIPGATAETVLTVIRNGAVQKDVDRVWLLVGYNDRTHAKIEDGIVAHAADLIQAEFPGADFFWTHTFYDLQRVPDSMKPDGVHLNEAGYEYLVNHHRQRGDL